MKRLALVAIVLACNASTAQVNQTVEDGLKLGGCIVATILGGVTDPAGIAAQCSGALPAVIVDVVDDVEAQKAPDAGVQAAALSTNQRALLDLAKANAMAAQAASR